MKFYEKLIEVQKELNAPKGQRNTFGNYNYRSCEDILEALKPLLAKNMLFQMLTDDVVSISDRIYVKSTVTVTDGENSVSNSAFAREPDKKKGMDDSQITGTSSSYARKYALNGMWNIDDNKDADTDAYQNQQQRQNKQQPQQRQQPNKQQPKKVEPNEVLSWAAEKFIDCSMAELKNLYTKCHKKLNGYPDAQQKLTQIKDIRKTELEVGTM